LEKVIQDYLTERNEKSKRYIWKAEGKKIGWEPYCEVNSNSVH